MSQAVYLIAYLAIIVFISAVIKRIVHYIRSPLHVRWEIYPVAHDSKRASYGGSYLEEVDWWKKERNVSLIGELKVMIPEILFLKTVWENNRPLWYITYPFHLGLYLTIAFFALLIIGAIAQLSGVAAGPKVPLLMSTVMALTNLIGPVGFILAIIGAAGLIYKRVTSPGLRNYSTFSHFFNLILFIVTMGIAILTWLFIDPTFILARAFIVNLISFNISQINSSLFLLQVLLAVLTIAYIPLTHMSHFFMKYFLYHDIRWGDEPNINTPETDKKIGVVLNYPVSWSAPHIAGHGKETWAEVATFNPVAEPETGKEKVDE
ncbi:MAG: nitrate reductase [Deltaproteobacteria bacterium]|nr:nitrate reductase [Deltaproteobacteria bacterium]